MSPLTFIRCLYASGAIEQHRNPKYKGPPTPHHRPFRYHLNCPRTPSSPKEHYHRNHILKALQKWSTMDPEDIPRVMVEIASTQYYPRNDVLYYACKVYMERK